MGNEETEMGVPSSCEILLQGKLHGMRPPEQSVSEVGDQKKEVEGDDKRSEIREMHVIGE